MTCRAFAGSLLLFATACAGADAAPPSAPTVAAAADPGGAASAAPEAAPAAVMGIALEKHVEPHVELLLPKGAKLLGPPPSGALQQWNWSFALDESKSNSIEIHVATGIDFGSMDDAVRQATMVGSKEVASKKQQNGGFLVVKAPEGPMPMSPVSVFMLGKSLSVECVAPQKYKELLVAVCGSARAR